MDNNQTQNKPDETIKNLKNVFVSNMIGVNIFLIFIGVILIGMFLGAVQTHVSTAKQQENHELALSETISILNRNTESYGKLTEIYHEGNWKTLDDFELLFSKGLFERILESDEAIRSDIFAELSSPSGISYLYLLDMDGRIVVSPDVSLIGVNPAATTHMTQENLNKILAWCRDSEGNVTPVLVQNQHGTFYFYSQPYVYGEQQYALVLGSSSWALDDRIASLKDVSNVLSRMGVINDGFLFAVNREDKLFQYYKNGKDLLTGQNAFASGLNEQILEDGYRGTQTILGEKYYCTSRSLDDNTVIVAAARSEDVVARDKYVMIWSVLSFLLVMSLCLVYAIIVRNDFIRQGIRTDRILINPKAKNRCISINPSSPRSSR